MSGLRHLRLAFSVWSEAAQGFERDGGPLVLSAPGVTELAHSPYLRGLEALDLSGNRVDDQSAAAIASGPWQLRELDLTNNLLGDDGLRTLATSGCFGQLATLRVANCPITSQGALALMSARTALPSLHTLDFEKCQLGAEGLTAVLEAFDLPALRTLRLGDGGAIALASNPGQHNSPRSNWGTIASAKRALPPSPHRRTSQGSNAWCSTSRNGVTSSLSSSPKPPRSPAAACT